jgi:hypothetical protein
MGLRASGDEQEAPPVSLSTEELGTSSGIVLSSMRIEEALRTE